MRTHGFRKVSQGAAPAISSCGRRKGRSIAWPNRCQPVEYNAHQTLSASPQACVRVTRMTSEGIHWAGNKRDVQTGTRVGHMIRHHVADAGACLYIAVSCARTH